MKKIGITHITPPQAGSLLTSHKKFYHVYLGNGLNVLFKNKKEADRLIRQTNKFLNQVIFDLSDLASKTYGIYRTCWFYLGENQDRTLLSGQVARSFALIDKQFIVVVARGSYYNGNYMTFVTLTRIADNLIEILSGVVEIHRKKSNFVEVHRLESILRHLSHIKENIAGWGFDKYKHTPLEKMGLQSVIKKPPVMDP